MGITLEAHLRALVHHYVDCHIYPNAIFLCERLLAHSSSEENLFLLASCFVRDGQDKRAYSVLQGCKLSKSRYLLATCCVKLGELTEAESVLLEGTGVLEHGLSASKDGLLERVPRGAAGLYLLGKICQRLNRQDHAAEYYILSLQYDPMLWSSYEGLCDLGVSVDPQALYGKLPPLPARAMDCREEELVLGRIGPIGVPQELQRQQQPPPAVNQPYTPVPDSSKRQGMASWGMPSSSLSLDGSVNHTPASGRSIGAEPSGKLLFGSPSLHMGAVAAASDSWAISGVKAAHGVGRTPGYTSVQATPAAAGAGCDVRGGMGSVSQVHAGASAFTGGAASAFAPRVLLDSSAAGIAAATPSFLAGRGGNAGVAAALFGTPNLTPIASAEAQMAASVRMPGHVDMDVETPLPTTGRGWHGG
ncbi:unnamed protein product, partial [Chrysoparadoxa australica]